MLSALLLTASLLARAAPPPAAAPRRGSAPAQFAGEGGGYKHPDESVGRFLEDAAAAPSGPSRSSAAATKSAPRKRGASASVPAPAPARARPSPRPPSRAASAMSIAIAAPPAPPGDVPLDAASDGARGDYETRLLGAPPARARPGLDQRGVPFPAAAMGAAAPSAPPQPSVAALNMPEPTLFVSLELEPGEAESLRDAVAGLGAAASFRLDPRFEPRPAGANGVWISGWLPPAKLGELVTRRGVRRVSVSAPARPAPGADAAWGEFVVSLRVDPSRPRESAAELAHALAAEAGFRYSEPPELAAGAATARLSGRLPLVRLSRALGMPGVLDIVPAASVEAPLPARARASGRRSFLEFAVERGPWLLVITLLLALPSFGRAVGRVLSMFVPYR